MIKCVVCDNLFEPTTGQTTCSPQCHEEYVRYLTWRFGEYKKVTRMSTGECFRVPVRDIVEKGVQEQDLDKYPKWEESGGVNDRN